MRDFKHCHLDNVTMSSWQRWQCLKWPRGQRWQADSIRYLVIACSTNAFKWRVRQIELRFTSLWRNSTVLVSPFPVSSWCAPASHFLTPTTRWVTRSLAVRILNFKRSLLYLKFLTQSHKRTVWGVFVGNFLIIKVSWDLAKRSKIPRWDYWESSGLFWV